MSSRRSSALLALAVLLLATAPVVGVATADNSTSTPTATPATTDTPTNETTDTRSSESTSTSTRSSRPRSSSGYSIEELQEDGTHLQLPSVRMGDERMMWLAYWPASNPFAETGTAEGGEYLPEDHTLGRNAVYLRTWTNEDVTEKVHIVYWERGTKEVTRGNTTTSVPVAKNVTEVTQEVDLERGRPTAKIPLRTHGDPVRVTMWIEGLEWARWTFKHDSIATAQSVEINSAGDYLTSVFVDFLIWILVGGALVTSVTKRALDRAGMGPGYGVGPWVVGLSLITGIGSLIFYRSVTELVVNAHIVVSAYLVGLLGVIMLETYTNGVSKALFLRPTLDYATSPTGDDAFDIIGGEADSERIVTKADGTVSVVSPGLLPFLSRVFGKSARLENVERLRTRVRLENSPWEELFIVDPEDEELLDYKREGWELSVPPMDRAHAPVYAAVGAAVALGVWAVDAGIAGGTPVALTLGAGLLVWAARPVDGEARVSPAPMHVRAAVGTMINFSEDVDDAKRFEEVKSQLDTERVKKQRQIDREVADHDRTLVEEMLDPEDEVPAAIELEDEEDEEVVDRGERSSGGPARADGGRDDE